MAKLVHQLLLRVMRRVATKTGPHCISHGADRSSGIVIARSETDPGRRNQVPEMRARNSNAVTVPYACISPPLAELIGMVEKLQIIMPATEAKSMREKWCRAP